MSYAFPISYKVFQIHTDGLKGKMSGQIVLTAETHHNTGIVTVVEYETVNHRIQKYFLITLAKTDL